MKVGIIGNGELAQALSKLFLRNGLNNFNISDIDKRKSQNISNSENIEDSDILFLCVKPNDIKNVLPLFTNFENKTIVSMAAGIPISQFEKYSSSPIRMMPNLPIQYKKGVITYFTKTEIPSFIKNICQGPKLIKCREEKLLDVSTISNGSMPAFISYFAKEYIQFAISRGFSPSEAQQAYISTLEGTIEMMKHIPLDKIISQVASPKGITECNLKFLDNSEIRDIIRESLEISMQHMVKLKQ